MDPQQETIETAIKIFEVKTGLRFEKKALKTALPTELRLRLKAAGVTQEFIVVFRKYINNKHILGTTLNALRHLPPKQLIIAEYINPAIAEKLRDMNIAFLDAAGNAFLNEPPIYVFITGNKPKQKLAYKQPKTLHAAALKVIFPLLCRPELINLTFRELARCTGVALGTIKNVMDDLRVRKHIVVTADHKPHLVNLKQLLQQWVLLYPTVLRPKLLVGRYTAPETDWWTKAKLPEEAAWGGEVAAAKLTNYLKPAETTIYTHGKTAPLLVQNRLREDPRGNVEILRAFWNREFQLTLTKLGEMRTVPVLLIYADLLATGDPRNIETAQRLYDREIAGRIS